MHVEAISPRVVALSLGVAAAVGLVAGGAGLTTRGTPEGDGTPASTSTSPHHNKNNETSSTTADSAATPPADESVAGKNDKGGDQKPTKPKKRSRPGVTVSPKAQSSLTPSPSASAPASSTPPPPSEPAVTTEPAAA